jgi:hypothetical protein
MTEDHDDEAVMERFDPMRSSLLRNICEEIALPRIRLAIEADQAADQERGEAEIGINAEKECLDVVGGQHGHPPLTEALSVYRQARS